MLDSRLPERMTMFSRILVPLDGSTFGERALPAAVSIARRLESSIDLVYVCGADVPPALGGMVVAPAYPAALEEERTEMTDYLDEVASRVKERGVEVSTTLLGGPVVHALSSYIARSNASLVVMSTHGRGGMSRAWLGSVAEGVIRDSSVPVLARRGSEDEELLSEHASVATDESFERILIPLDGSGNAEQVIDQAMALASPGASVTLLEVVVPASIRARTLVPQVVDTDPAGTAKRRDAARDYLAGVANGLRDRGIKVDTDVAVDDSPARVILGRAADGGYDLLAMATHGRGSLMRLVMGSVADKVVRGASVPVLLQRPVSPV